MLLKVGQEIMLLFNSGVFWSQSKRKTGRSYCLQEIKSCLKFLLNNSFFQVGSKIFHQVTGIPMGSDLAPFLANLFLSFYESRWLKSVKNTNYGVARKFGNILRFIDDLIAIKDGNEFENHYNEIYPSELILKKENTSHIETTFQDPDLCIRYDKWNSYNFNILRFPYKSTTIPSKILFATISAEILSSNFLCGTNY